MAPVPIGPTLKPDKSSFARIFNFLAAAFGVLMLAGALSVSDKGPYLPGQ